MLVLTIAPTIIGNQNVMFSIVPSNALELGLGDNMLSFDWIGLWKTTKSGQFRSMIWEIGK